MIRRMVRSLLDALGYEFRRKPLRPNDPYELPDPLEAEIRSAIAVVDPYTMQSEGRLDMLYRQVVHCETHRIPGSFVECGVWKGGGMGLMALANLRHGVERRSLHLFDSFQEICEPDASVDGPRAIAHMRSLTTTPVGTSGALRPLVGVYDSFGGPGTLEENKRLLEETIGYDAGYIHYHKGWFQDTIPRTAVEIGEIAILRLDGDWYHSTTVCLEHLYPHVVRGGFVIIDDYRYYEGCTKAVDEYIRQRAIPAFLLPEEPGVKYHVFWIKP
jgi:O-methyltransferase